MTRVVRYTTVDDVGVAINPMLVTGQVHGGVAQGIGQALYEGVTYSAKVSCSPRAIRITAFRAPTTFRRSR